jgi:hypothetical protein
MIYGADGSMCTGDAPFQISYIKHDILTIHGITGSPSEHTWNESSISHQVFDCWLETIAVTEMANLTPDDKTTLGFSYVPPAERTARVDSGNQCPPRLDSRRAKGKFGMGASASLLVMSNMPQTGKRTTEISESIIAVASSNEERALVTGPGVSKWKRHLSSLSNFMANILGIRSCDDFGYDSNRWIKGCVDVKTPGRSTCAMSKDKSCSQEAGRLFPGIDMAVRRPNAGHVYVDSSLFYDIIAFILVAPTTAFVITSWGMVEEFPLCTRDHSVPVSFL